MIVHNKTKSIRTFPVDHKGTQVATAYPGWSDIPDDAWFTIEVTNTTESDIKSYGKVVKHGAEIHAKGISADQLEILGEVDLKGSKGPRKSLGLKDIPNAKALEIISGCNSSVTLKEWSKSVGEELRIAIANQLNELKEARNKSLNED